MRTGPRSCSTRNRALAASLASTWGASGEAFSPTHLPFDRLLAHTDAPVTTVAAVAKVPVPPSSPATGWDPFLGTTTASSGGCAPLWAAVTRWWCAPRGRAPAPGWRRCCGGGDDGTPADPSETAGADLAKPGVRVIIPALERGFVYPGLKLAVLSESDLTGRRRAPPAHALSGRATETFFDDLKAGAHVVHYQHGVGRFTHGHPVHRRDGARLPAARVPRGRQAVRPVGSDRPVEALYGGRLAECQPPGRCRLQRAKSRVRAAARQIAQELVVLYQKRMHSPGHAFGPDTRGRRSWKAAFSLYGDARTR